LITDFKAFGVIHIAALIVPLLIGALLVYAGKTAKTDKAKLNIRIIFLILLILVRGTRWILDLAYGNFELSDFLSLHICNIDFLLLIICFIKPSKILFNITFLVGIPMGLSVALLPGPIHKAPLVLWGFLFVMSHMLLVLGPIYLAIVEKMELRFKYLIYTIVIGNVYAVIVYFINIPLNTNYLYINSAPAGSAIEKLNSMFGWPGYVLAMDVIAIAVMLLIFLIDKAIVKMARSQ
jgi:hypothetical integral membrane protein (TIGR02206 family)